MLLLIDMYIMYMILIVGLCISQIRKKERIKKSVFIT